jgi:hypothetical protein
MTVEHGMDGAFGWHPDLAAQAADEQFADLARAPSGVFRA